MTPLPSTFPAAAARAHLLRGASSLGVASAAATREGGLAALYTTIDRSWSCTRASKSSSDTPAHLEMKVSTLSRYLWAHWRRYVAARHQRPGEGLPSVWTHNKAGHTRRTTKPDTQGAQQSLTGKAHNKAGHTRRTTKLDRQARACLMHRHKPIGPHCSPDCA